jgi:hypothetical protein
MYSYLFITIYLHFWPVLDLTAHCVPTVDHMNMNEWMQYDRLLCWGHRIPICQPPPHTFSYYTSLVSSSGQTLLFTQMLILLTFCSDKQVEQLN